MWHLMSQACWLLVEMVLANKAAGGDRPGGKVQLHACTVVSQLLGEQAGPCFNLGLLLFEYGEATRSGDHGH